jgi:bacterioferritin (cytochrome b1)
MHRWSGLRRTPRVAFDGPWGRPGLGLALRSLTPEASFRPSDPSRKTQASMSHASTTATGIQAQGAAAGFARHAREELGHADQLSERIVQLGGAPNFDPDQLSKHSRAQDFEVTDLDEMLREALVAERIALDSDAERIRDLGADETTTRRMLEGILAVEEAHAEDLTRPLRAQTA